MLSTIVSGVRLRFYGKKTTLFLLVIVPLLLSVLYVVTPLIVPAILLYVCVPIYLAYGLVGRGYSASRYFTEKGLENTVNEYEFVKKIIYVMFPLLIIVTTVSYIPFFTIDQTIAGSSNQTIGGPSNQTIGEPSNQTRPPSFVTLAFSTYPKTVDAALSGLNTFLSISVVGGILRLVIPLSKKDFRFYFAKTLLEMASKEKEETKKTNYVIKGIKFYDRYLRRNLNLQINNMNEIISIFMADSLENKNVAIQSLLASFEDENEKLKPARCLSEITHVQETKSFFIEESIGQQLKNLAIFLATIIPVAITVFKLLTFTE